jgi:hypothetical protein
MKNSGRKTLRQTIWTRLLWLALGAVTLLSTAAQATVPNPTVTGPIAATAIPGDPSHNYPFFASNKDLPLTATLNKNSLFKVRPTATRRRAWLPARSWTVVTPI